MPTGLTGRPWLRREKRQHDHGPQPWFGSQNVPWLCSRGVRFTEDGRIVPPKKDIGKGRMAQIIQFPPNDDQSFEDVVSICKEFALITCEHLEAYKRGD